MTHAAGVLTLTSAATFAQTSYQPASTGDTYGNRGPLDLSPRELGLYQNDYQQRLLTSYLNQGRRVRRRGGGLPFAIASDRLRRRPASAPLLSLYQSVATRRPSAGTTGKSVYGGFGERSSMGRPGTAATAFRRRLALISATALNAPIRRADRTGSLSLGLSTRPAPVGQHTSLLPARPADQTVGSQIELNQHLVSWGQTAGERALAEAWRLFGDGQYRRAARAFSQAASLHPAEAEPRIGEMFCFVAVGAIRSAVTVMQQWQARDEGLFLHPVDMTNAFSDPRQAFDLRVELRLVASGENVGPDVRGLYVLVLWYLGHVDEAMLVAQNLAVEAPRLAYAGWPPKMQRAQQLQGKESRQD